MSGPEGTTVAGRAEFGIALVCDELVAIVGASSQVSDDGSPYRRRGRLRSLV